MKITEEYINQTDQVIAVEEANYLEEYTIYLRFNDGSEKAVDFQPFLEKSSHPSIKKYLDKNFFKQFEIVHGNLNWNDYDLIFPVAELWEGRVSL